jgi:hypothetical protein
LKRAYLLFTILLFYFSLSTKAQEGFRFYNQSKNHQRITFKLINNLIVIPLKINGENLSFILDTGVNKTIIFSVSEKDSIGLLNPEKITLRGLGGGEPVAAILSKKNRIKIKGLVSNNETIYVILKDFFDLSSKMGTTIHGIIGYNLLKNFIIKINYDSKKIDFYNPKKYKYKKCRKCEILPIQFYRKKPFVNLQIQLDTVGTMLIKVKMLIDSGGSDAIWLFEDSKPEIKTPLRFFNDILGEGLSGVILGKRSRIPKLKIGNFEIEKPTVSFLDSISTKEARRLKNRNGSIGGNILKRFIVWLDYPNKQVILKKNGSLKKGFNYNMSGLDIVYAGNQLIKEEVAKPSGVIYNKQADGSNTISFATNFTYKFKPVYKIKSVVKNSAADKVGLRAGDIILKINQNFSHSYKLNEIINKFQERDKKKIKIIVERNGDKLKFEFRLEKKV